MRVLEHGGNRSCQHELLAGDTYLSTDRCPFSFEQKGVRIWWPAAMAPWRGLRMVKGALLVACVLVLVLPQLRLGLASGSTLLSV